MHISSNHFLCAKTILADGSTEEYPQSKLEPTQDMEAGIQDLKHGKRIPMTMTPLSVYHFEHFPNHGMWSPTLTHLKVSHIFSIYDQLI